MRLPAVYIIGAESIGDYLEELETRFGIRLAFTLELPRSKETQAPFVVWLRIPNPTHAMEIYWFDDMLHVPEDKPSIDLVRIMWDMLYMADQVLVKGPEELEDLTNS